MGYAAGSDQIASSSYTGEICHPNTRKFTGTFGALFYTLGYAIMYLLGVFFHWRETLSIIMIWPLVCVIGLYFCPDSPTWLLIKGRTNEATNSMRYLRGTKQDAEIEIKKLENNMEEQRAHLESLEDKSYLKTCYILLKQGTFLRPFLIILVLSLIHI